MHWLRRERAAALRAHSAEPGTISAAYESKGSQAKCPGLGVEPMPCKLAGILALRVENSTLTPPWPVLSGAFTPPASRCHEVGGGSPSARSWRSSPPHGNRHQFHRHLSPHRPIQAAAAVRHRTRGRGRCRGCRRGRGLTSRRAIAWPIAAARRARTATERVMLADEARPDTRDGSTT